MKRYMLLLLCTILGMTLTVGAQDTNEQACPLADGTLTIAWIPKALDNPVFELGRVGAETRAAELSAAGPCNVDVFVAAPFNTTAEDQVDLLFDIIDLDDIDAIGVSCIDPVACIEPINAATEAGIPVMTWDSDSPDSNRITYLGIDNYEGGRAAAELLVRAMGESGEVAILSGVEGSLNLDERIRGFLDYIEENELDIEIVATVYSNDNPVLGAELVEEVMAEHPDLDGWFMVGLWPLLIGRGGMPTWEAASEAGEMFTVTFDTLPVELDWMADGYIHGLVGQKYWGWGYDTVQMLYDHVLEGVEYESFTNSGMDIVTELNLEAMIEAWTNNDFTQPLPDPFGIETTPEATAEAND